MKLSIWFGCTLALLCAAPAAAQSVRGRVLDAGTGQSVADVRVTLVRSTGNRVASVVSDPQGRFHINASGGGEFRLETSHIAYRDVSTELITVGANEQVSVDVKLTTAAVALEPLTIVARRVDARHLATEEGLYARRLSVPPIGNARVFMANDPEMRYSSTVRDLTSWTGRPRGCTVMFWNGFVVHDSAFTQELWNTPVSLLEGVEYYRTPSDAPHVFQERPAFAHWTDRGGGAFCSIVALWSRTGNYTAEYLPPLTAQGTPWETVLAATMYRVRGEYAPGTGAGLELTSYWPVNDRFAVGLLVRGTRHTLASEPSDTLTSVLSSISYRLPPGALPVTIVAAGLEPRVVLLETDRVRFALGARVQLAVRRFKLREIAVGEHYDSFNARGWGAGGVGSAEFRLSERFTANIGMAYDRISFNEFPQTDRGGTSTAADWTGTALRVGFVYGAR